MTNSDVKAIEVYFDPNVLKKLAQNEANNLLEQLRNCTYDSTKNSNNGRPQEKPFRHIDTGKPVTSIKEEGKIISIAITETGRSSADRLYAYFDKDTNRMYITYFLEDHANHKEIYEKWIDNGVDAPDMQKINAHQAALNNHREPSANLGFVKSTSVSPQSYVYANITVDAVKKEYPDLSDIVYDNVNSLQEGFSTMLKDYKQDIYLRKYDDTPKTIQENRQAFRDMINDLVKDDNPTITKQKQQVIQSFINNIYRSLRNNRNISDSDKKFIKEVVKEINEAFERKPAPLVDFSENREQPNNKANQTNRANQTRIQLRTLSQNAWKNIDPNNPSKGIQKRVSSYSEGSNIMGQYQQYGIKWKYNSATKCIEITDASSIQKIQELETRGTIYGSSTTSRPTSVGICSGGRRNNAAKTNGSTHRRGRRQTQTLINLGR